MEAVEHLIKPRLSVVQPSKAFDPIIEMVWTANASHLNLKVPEGTVGQIGPIDTQPSPSHVEGSDEQATENEPYVASAPIQETCGSASVSHFTPLLVLLLFFIFFNLLIR